MNESTMRRGIHLLIPLFLVYYWLPDLLLGIEKEYLLLCFLAFTLFFDWVRSRQGIRIKGLRWYESGKMAAYAWFGVGFTICVLFFEENFVIPSVIVLGFVDPLCSISRNSQYLPYPILPLAVSFGIFFQYFIWAGGHGIGAAFFLAAPGACIAIAAERPSIEYLDDDLLMQVAPAGVLTLLALLIPWL